ncbi:cytochrome b/b6 domain-containing protein [Edaphobacter flagellatus]|uniref:cytochrome b/b6 domain-containing protein n=1 Tax=Edaphobacter flagellatus TaxID=1933044 RepID=UPI0021B4600E|nr:cytochrome b/b6 domain-containing protein [Edaphobacter flagellatus]
MLRIEERHPLAVRWMHWINFPLLMIMIWSGLMVYWVTSPDNGVLDHQTYRIGLGGFTLFRFFPDWFYRLFRLDNHLTRGMAFHALAMWPFMVNGVVYLIFLAVSGQWREILPTRRDLQELVQTFWLAIIRSDHAGKYNGAQRIAYTSVLIVGAVAVVSGFAIWKPTSMPWLTAMLGGYQAARLIHFWTTILFCVFLFVHAVQVVRAGWPTMQSMITGFEVVSDKVEVQEAAHGD